MCILAMQYLYTHQDISKESVPSSAHNPITKTQEFKNNWVNPDIFGGTWLHYKISLALAPMKLCNWGYNKWTKWRERIKKIYHSHPVPMPLNLRTNHSLLATLPSPSTQMILTLNLNTSKYTQMGLIAYTITNPITTLVFIATNTSNTMPCQRYVHKLNTIIKHWIFNYLPGSDVQI